MASNFQELCSPLLGSLDGEVFSFMVVSFLFDTKARFFYLVFCHCYSSFSLSLGVAVMKDM